MGNPKKISNPIVNNISLIAFLLLNDTTSLYIEYTWIYNNNQDSRCAIILAEISLISTTSCKYNRRQPVKYFLILPLVATLKAEQLLQIQPCAYAKNLHLLLISSPAWTASALIMPSASTKWPEGACKLKIWIRHWWSKLQVSEKRICW